MHILDFYKVQKLCIEHGGSGSSVAAPIAKKLFKLIIDRHELREKQTKQNNLEI